MTYTIMARCERTGDTGIGITTASIAVGGLCPFVTTDGDLVSSQAYARPETGLTAMRWLQSGNALDELGQRPRGS